MKLKLIAATTLVLSSGFASADSWLIGADIRAGGDTLVRFTDGTKQTAGDGVGVFLGYEFDDGPEDLWLPRVSIGYSFDDPDVANGSTEVTRYPLEAVMLRRAGSHRFGGGIAYHISPEWKLNAPGFASGTVDFDDAVGIMGQYSWQTSSFEIGAKYTDIDYDPSRGGNSIDASSFAVFFNAMF